MPEQKKKLFDRNRTGHLMSRVTGDLFEITELAGINGELESSLSGMRTAKAFTSESVEIEKFARSNDRFKTSKARYYKALASYFSGLEFIMGLFCDVIACRGLGKRIVKTVGGKVRKGRTVLELERYVSWSSIKSSA